MVFIASLRSDAENGDVLQILVLSMPDIPRYFDVFKPSTERENTPFHVLSKPQQKGQKWREHVLGNNTILAYAHL